MQWTLITPGLLLFLAVGGVTLLSRRKTRTITGCRVRYCHARIFKPSLRWLKKAARLPAATEDIHYLQDSIRPLMEHVLRLRRDLRLCPALPADANAGPRLLSLAHDIVDEGIFTPDALLRSLSDWAHQPSTSEISTLPLFVSAAQYQRLNRVLHAIVSDAKARTAAIRLVSRLLRSKHPARLLDKASVRSVGLAELAKQIRCQDPDGLLPVYEGWLSTHVLSTEALIQQSLGRQVQLMEELRRALECFDAMTRMNWLSSCAEADTLHPILMEDPAGVYPRLTPASQLELRIRVEALARHIHVDAEEILRCALALSCRETSAAIEQNVCYWLQDTEGLSRLHRALPSAKGRLYAQLLPRSAEMHYAFLWCFGIITGFAFLQSRGPVFMLPFFALVMGCVSRWILRRIPKRSLPRKKLSCDTASALRTLVVLPAVLADSHEAIRMVRRVKTLTHTFPQDVDFLLLGDFSPAITPVSSGDLPIIQAAASAVGALADERIMYLQRSRAWDDARHHYGPRGGQLGAVTEVCRLIAQGECEDTVAFATVEAAFFERKYAYVLSIPADCQPAPGMYETLLETMAHPLCSRRPICTGWRGYAVLSPKGDALFDGLGLIRPDAFLEAIDGVTFPHSESAQLCGELSGHASVPDAHAHRTIPSNPYNHKYKQAVQAWRYLKWQLPFVQTPSGLITNPLSQTGRFRLRELLRDALVPLGQFILLIYAILTQQWLLMMAALLAPELGHPMRRMQDAVQLVCRISLLPTLTAIPLRALGDVLLRKSVQPVWSATEAWAQGIAATVIATLSSVLPGSFVPAFALGVLFACFPLAHRYMDAPLTNTKGLTNEHIALLNRAAAATWRFFQQNMTEATRYLPPISAQFEPPLGPAAEISPESIGAGLLACICAAELGLLSANDAAQHIAQIAASLGELPLPFGLPCRRYALPALTVTDAGTDGKGCGFLLCALMTAAQALRTWLPDLTSEHASLSGQLENIAASFEADRLYDPGAGLFHLGLDENGQPTGYAETFSDESLLLSVAACARQLIPPEHFSHLRRTQVHAYSEDIPLSRQGTAAAHLLTGLFLPSDVQTAAAFIRAMQKRGCKGLFGQSGCSFYAFDPSLHYRHDVFGLQEAASTTVSDAPVFTPYAAALCLPHLPWEAAEALRHYDALGALGPNGFCDAVDLSQDASLVMLHDTYHQGLILTALTHLLADAPIRRYFCALPQTEACLPLLNPSSSSLLLPAVRIRRPLIAAKSVDEYSANPQIWPSLAHVLGTADFRMIITSRGDSLLFDSGLPLTKTTYDSPFGIQFYLAEEGNCIRIGMPAASPDVAFGPGEVRFEQRFGSLRIELICTVDTVRKRALHIVTITNLSTRDRQIELADFLFPDLQVPASTLEAEQPAKNHLVLHARSTGAALHHTVQTLVPPLSQCACTDSDTFLGRSMTLDAPAFLNTSMQDQVVCSATPCISFRLQIALGGRSQASAWFTTSLENEDAPQLSELNGIRRLAALQHTAIENIADLPPGCLRNIYRLLLPAIEAGGCMTIRLSSSPSTDVLTSLCDIRRWLHLHGVEIDLYVLCIDEVREIIPAALSEQVSFLPPSVMPKGLFLDGDVPLSAQLDSMQTLCHAPVSSRLPMPALLPRQELLHRCICGGFDAATSDFIVELDPEQTTPVPWENQHISRHFTETVDERGLRFPFDERVFLRHTDGTLLAPWSHELPRAVRFGVNETAWEAWTDRLDLRLTAACLPGHRCALRVLRIRNASSTPETLEISVLARLPVGGTPLETSPGVVTCAARNHPHLAFIAGTDWEARRVIGMQSAGQPPLDQPDTEHGRLAMLRTVLTLAPNASGKIIWFSGYARHGEDIARVLSVTASANPSEFLHAVRRDAAQRLSAFSLSSPEDTLDLLVNRILPVQALAAEDGLAMLPLLFLSPREAARELLHTARSANTREDYARLALLLEKYVRHTGDESMLEVRFPAKSDSLYACCVDAISTLPLDRDGLPLQESQALHCFLFAAAAQALDRLRPSNHLQELHRRLLHAADTHLWAEGHYGEPLRLDVQNLALLASGPNPRTRQAFSRCWAALYDQPHGLIRTHQPLDVPSLPGLPDNGGMRTIDAALCLHALFQTAHHEEAFELLRALNPLHHTDDPLRMKTFRCAPYRLHGGMYAAPMEAGRAVPEGGHFAAALLYAVILEDLLGLQRSGSVLRLNPCVPPEWDGFTVTLQEGSATWRVSMERHCRTATIDSTEFDGNSIELFDDGKIHHVHVPLK